MIAQTILPSKWVIVDNRSTDRTPEMVERYVQQHPWIELLRRSPRKDRNFAGKSTQLTMVSHRSSIFPSNW